MKIKYLDHSQRVGNFSKIIIEENVSFWGGIIYVEDDNNELHIGKGTTIYDAELAVAEGCKLKLGNDCLLSKEIRISTTDSHPIICMKSHERLNPAGDIDIGNHVWIGFRTSINKGVSIGDGSVIGNETVVTHDISANTCAVGVPAKVIKNNIEWKHNRK